MDVMVGRRATITLPGFNPSLTKIISSGASDPA